MLRNGLKNTDMDKLKKFGINLAVAFAVTVLREFLRKHIAAVTPSQMYDAIRNDVDVWSITPEDIKIAGKNLKKKFGKVLMKYADMLTVDLVLRWLSEDFPDLYSVIINTDGGILWLDRQINKIKKHILSDEYG